jgi:hypothetical protein
VPAPANALSPSVERAGAAWRRPATVRSVQYRRDVSRSDTCEIGPTAGPTYNHIGTVVVASAWLAFYVVGAIVL